MTRGWFEYTLFTGITARLQRDVLRPNSDPTKIVGAIANDIREIMMALITVENIVDMLTITTASAAAWRKPDYSRREHEEKPRKAATLEMMERGMEDIREGRTKPAEKALREIAERLGLALDR
jgi:hypothetical protein